MAELQISFLPRSVSHDWVHAETPEEICGCLEEIALAYQSMSPAERGSCTGDMEKIVSTTMRDLICDATDVVTHGLIVLDHISRDHAKFFIHSLPTLFVRIKRYIVGKNETIRRHAVRLAGSLAVHLPLKTMGPHLLTLLHDETVDRGITIKLAALGLLYSRTGGDSSPYVQEYAKDGLDTCVDFLDYNNITLIVPPKTGSVDMTPASAIVDFIAILMRVFVFDSLFSHALMTDMDTALFQKCRDQLPADVDDVLDQMIISAGVGKEICWRAQANEFPTLQNDPIVASFAAHALSLPANTFHQNVDDDIDVEDEADNSLASDNNEGSEEIVDEAKIFGAIKRAQSMDSDKSPGKKMSPGKPGTPDSVSGSSVCSADKMVMFGKHKSYSVDFDERLTPQSSPLTSPLRKVPSNTFLASPRSSSKADLLASEQDSPTRDRCAVVSPSASSSRDRALKLGDSGSGSKVTLESLNISPRLNSVKSPHPLLTKDITSMMVENGSQTNSPIRKKDSDDSTARSPNPLLNKDITSMMAENGSQTNSPTRHKDSEDSAVTIGSHQYPFIDLTCAEADTPIISEKLLQQSDSASGGMTQSLSSNAISTMPYQPPPTSWGLGLAHNAESGMDNKVSQSRSTAGATTASTMSSGTPGVAAGLPMSGDAEDWQRLATPWLYLPTTANGEKNFTPGSGSDTGGLNTPTREGPLDKSKLKTLKRPGRNFRSSNTAGANQPSAKASESLGETRAYTAGLVPSGIDEQMTQWGSASSDAAEQSLTRQSSSSFSGPFGEVGDAIKSINAMSQDAADYRTPMKRKAKTNPTFASPPRHDSEQLPEIGSATPHEKGAYSDDGKRVHLLAHPYDSHGVDANAVARAGIGAVKVKRRLSNNEGEIGGLGRTAISVAEIFDDDDLSPAYEVSEQDMDSVAVMGVPRPRRTSKPVALNLNIDIENSSVNPPVAVHSTTPKSEFGPYIESPAMGKSKKMTLSPSVRGRGGRRGNSRFSMPSPRTEEENESDTAEEPKHLPVISGHAEYGVDASGAPLHKPADQFEYITSEDIQPLENPSKEVSKVTRGLDTGEWPDIFHTINKMRQLSLHHSSVVLNAGCLHPMVMGVVKQADNLRSAVCKNALLATTDMLIGFGRVMDGESQNMMPMLLKRSVDSSAFLSGSANAALCAMMERISVSRAFALLMQFGAEHKTAGIRGTTVNCISHLVSVRTEELKGPAGKDCLDALKTRLSKFLSDPNPNVRAQSREIVRQLVTNSILTRTQVEQIVAPNMVAKALQESSANASLMTPLSSYSSRLGEGGLQVVAEGGGRGGGATPRGAGRKITGSPLNTVKKRPSVVSRAREEMRLQGESSEDDMISPRGGESLELGVSGLGSTARGGVSNRAREGQKYSALQAAHAKQQIDTMGDLVELPEAMKKLVSKNWSERNEAISHITDSILESSAILAKAGKLEGLIDAVLEKFEDGSIKVCIHALTCLAKVHQNLPDLLPSMYSTVVPAFLTASSSANRQISTIGSDVFNNLVQLIPPMPLMQKLCSIAVHDKDRMRCSAFRTITGYISKSETALDAHLLQRVIFPVICQTVCAGASKPEVRTAANEALRALQRSCKEPVWKWTLNLQQQAEIRRLTGCP